MIHSTHFIYGYMVWRYLVKDSLDSEWGNPMPPHGLNFPTDKKAHIVAFDTPVAEHWLKQDSPVLPMLFTKHISQSSISFTNFNMD